MRPKFKLALYFFLINTFIDYFQEKKDLVTGSNLKKFASLVLIVIDQDHIRRRANSRPLNSVPSFLFFKNIKSMATVFEVTECFGTYIDWIFFSEIVFIMQVADRPGDISILTHIFVSDNRTVVLYLGAACSWKLAVILKIQYYPPTTSSFWRNFLFLFEFPFTCFILLLLVINYCNCVVTSTHTSSAL